VNEGALTDARPCVFPDLFNKARAGYFAITHQAGYAIPMLIGTIFTAISFIVGPETKGKAMTAEVVIA
jgi:hypothetical protein